MKQYQYGGSEIALKNTNDKPMATTKSPVHQKEAEINPANTHHLSGGKRGGSGHGGGEDNGLHG